MVYTQICSRILFNLEKESCIIQHGWNEGHSQDSFIELSLHSVIYRHVLPITVEYHVHNSLRCPWKGAVTIWNIPMLCRPSSPGVTFVLYRKLSLLMFTPFLQDREFGVSSSCSGAHTCMEIHMYFCWIDFYWCCRLSKWAATLLNFTLEAGFLHSF